ncbi:hypothetical protein CN938_21940 [Bacillus thuringiensis]|nr:hypothetical protein CON29_16035 [Bacillus thuringiensis]PGQ54043.1 hypothetical protein COA22_17445 [Bacillus cereus]PFB82352.1 hypothetical protein CN283_22395 [Bacillus thuringiensis]PFM95352.1 hypothetical protein COJ51_21420 [Bacillus thuringiensis]PFT09109.1 hypothetical protein COK59_09400 [Bacillus thuringiensis]
MRCSFLILGEADNYLVVYLLDANMKEVSIIWLYCRKILPEECLSLIYPVYTSNISFFAKL